MPNVRRPLADTAVPPSSALHAAVPAAAILATLLIAPLATIRAHAAPRLGNDVRPLSESVALTLDPERADYTGRVSAELEVAAAVDRFRLHARALHVTRVELRGTGGTIAARADSVAPDQIAIVPATPLAAGHYTLTLDFTNRYERRAAALYRVETGGHSYLFTQFEATEAREAFPCWDEPAFKIPWQLTLTVPAADLAVSNTSVERETPNGTLKTVAFRRTRPLPSYLVAIAVGPFETVPIRGMSVPGRVVTVKGAAALAAEAAKVTPPIVASLEHYFGRNYPYDKLDLIAAPEFLYGAMENAGAVVFSDKRLLLDARASADAQKSMRSVIAHELSHMWFGDYVTMHWWDDLWLNESFASWMANKVMDEVFPEYRDGQSVLAGGQRAMETDSRPSTHAMRQPVEDENNLSSSANELTYNKGLAVLRMFEGWLGAEKFRAGVLRYLDAHAWGNATGSDLWTALSEASGQDINGAMASFLDQPGVPLVTVENSGVGAVRLRQRRFDSSGDARAAGLWRIPVILAYPQGAQLATQRVWLRDSVMTVALDGAARPRWIDPNAGSSGYYLWDVGPERLEAIAADRRLLSPVERIGYLRELPSLLRAGRIHADQYLERVRVFRDDAEPEVTQAVIAALEALREPLVSEPLADAFAVDVRAILQPALDRIGVEPRPRELPAAALLRPKLLVALGDLGRDPTVRAWADSVTRGVLAGRTALEGWSGESALPLAAMRTDAATWNQLRERFESAVVPGDRGVFLTALGNVRDPRLVEAALRYALSGPLRPQEVYLLPEALSGYAPNRDAIYRWMSEHFSEVVGRIPSHMVTRLMPALRGCAPERYDAARQFFADPAHTFPAASVAISRVGDAVADCVRLHERDAERFERFLRTATARP